MEIHFLKILPEYFKLVVEGKKKFELRRNDRDFKVGDMIILCEFDGKESTGNSLPFVITYILKGGQYGLDEDYVVLSIEEVGSYNS